MGIDFLLETLKDIGIFLGKKALEQLPTATVFSSSGIIMNIVSGVLKPLEVELQKLDKDIKIDPKDFTPMGALSYWNDVYSEISKVNVQLGVAGNVSNAIKGQFKEAFIELGDMGIEAKEIAENIKQFMDDYGRVTLLSKQEMVEMSQMAEVFGKESLAIVSSYKDLGLSIETTTARMKKLTLESNKYGVLPSRAIKLIKENLSAVDKYYFKGGTKAFEHMALKAASLNNDMKGSFTMIDKILDGGIEGAVEMAQEFQIMGGPIAQMGDVFGLIQKALSGDVEGFTNDMAKAAAQMATINSEGEIMFDPAAMLQFRQLASKTGVDIQEITKLGRAMAKEMDISKQLDLSLKSTPEKFEEMTKKVAGAVKGKNAFGDWVVTIDGIEKKVQDLTEEDINAKLSISPEGDEKDTFKEIVRSNMDLGAVIQTLIHELKRSALSGAGDYYLELMPKLKELSENAGTFLKDYTEMFSDISRKAYENADKVLDPLIQGDFLGALQGALTNIFNSATTFQQIFIAAIIEAGKIIGNVLWNAGQYLYAAGSYFIKWMGLELQKALYEAANKIAIAFGIPFKVINTENMKMEETFSEYMKKNVKLVDVLEGVDWRNITDSFMKKPEETEKYEPIKGLSEFGSDYIRMMIPNEGEKPKTVDDKQYLEVKGEIMLINADGSKVPLTEEQIVELVKNLATGKYRTP
jgi:hypothetical protein